MVRIGSARNQDTPGEDGHRTETFGAAKHGRDGRRRARFQTARFGGASHRLGQVRFVLEWLGEARLGMARNRHRGRVRLRVASPSKPRRGTARKAGSGVARICWSRRVMEGFGWARNRHPGKVGSGEVRKRRVRQHVDGEGMAGRDGARFKTTRQDWARNRMAWRGYVGLALVRFGRAWNSQHGMAG